MNQNPNYQQAPQPQYQPPSIETQLKAILSSTKGWIMFFGIMNIIMAAIVTIATLGVGILGAWIPLILGIFLVSAANKIKNYLLLGNPMSLLEYHKQIKNFFVFIGVMTIISLVLNIIMIIVVIITGATLIPGGFNWPW